ncbi:GntR family transcriptional regulator [Pseudonocardia sichuanensis]
MADDPVFARSFELPKSRIDHVLEQIRSGILTQRLAPGRPLVEAELARELGVSKTPVREALKMLSLSGLVTFTPYKGASVRTVDEHLARSVYEVRILLEPEGLKRAVEAKSAFDRAAAVLGEAREAGVAGDRARLSLLNRTFHGLLYADCGNPVLIDILENLRDRAALISIVGWEKSPTWEEEWREHRKILGAALEGDAERAALLLRDHVQGFLDRTLAAMAAEE